MSFFGNLVRSLTSSEGTFTDRVEEVNISPYIRIPVIAREESLVLYGPTHNNRYELLLQKRVEDSLKTAFSLFRVPDVVDARSRFLVLKTVLVPFIQVIPHIVLNKSSLQKICDCLKGNPTWTVAHISSHLDYVQAFTHPDIASMANTAEIDQKVTPLHIAIKEEKLKMIQTLLGVGVSVDPTDEKGNSAFHLAATTNEKIIQAVTSRSSKLLDAQNNAGKTPLHLACENDKPDCVKALLIAGADVNVASPDSASFPIHTAIQVDSTLCAKEIIDMYPNQLYVEDMKHGGTPLHWATSRQMIDALVELGCRVNAANFRGSTALHNMVQHNRLPCVLALLSWDGDANIRNDEGNTSLHLASSPAVVQALLVFEADPSIRNNKGENARHVVATSSYNEKNTILYILHSVGAPRCPKQLATCSDGCSPTRRYDGEPPPVSPMSRIRTHYDEFLDDALNNLDTTSSIGFTAPPPRGGRVLSLDGGGIKGLVLIQLLLVLQKEGRLPITQLFDWICGTSTGGILALAIAMGRSPRYCQGLYLRLKDKVFVDQRPYSAEPLENILKKEFGETTRMTDIKDVKVVVTGVLADRFPADLHLFRNYVDGETLLHCKNGVTDSPVFVPTQPPHEQLVWQAARASGAAPSYFSAFGRFIDGGLISNNPTLDMLTEIVEHNAVLRSLAREDETEKIRVVVSLGTGRLPVSKVNAIDVFRPEGFLKGLQMVFGLTNMTKLLIDQVTMADNRTVDRARAWCGMAGISYLRLTPQLSLDIELDETRDEVLVNMLWETLVYALSKKQKIKKVLRLLQQGTRDPCSQNDDIMVVD